MIALVLFLFALRAEAGPEKTVTKLNPFAVASKTTPTPRLLGVRGQVQVMTGRDEKYAPAKNGLKLVERAEIGTGPDSTVKIELDAGRELTVFENTKIRIPGIRWEGGEIPLIILENGRVRWRSEAGGAPLRLQSTLFDLSPGSGDFIFRYNPKSPEAELQVLRGRQDFSASNAEDSVTLKEREAVTFQGSLEDGEIAADILLQGKRIPRGKLGPVRKLSDAEIAPFLDEEKRTRAAAQKAEDARRVHAASDLKAGVICASPRGKLNECSWTCEGNPKKAKTCVWDKSKCVRRRCNANGTWAEPAELTTEDARLRCRLNPVVAACDY